MGRCKSITQDGEGGGGQVRLKTGFSRDTWNVGHTLREEGNLRCTADGRGGQEVRRRKVGTRGLVFHLSASSSLNSSLRRVRNAPRSAKSETQSVLVGKGRRVTRRQEMKAKLVTCRIMQAGSLEKLRSDAGQPLLAA